MGRFLGPPLGGPGSWCYLCQLWYAYYSSKDLLLHRQITGEICFRKPLFKQLLRGSAVFTHAQFSIHTPLLLFLHLHRKSQALPSWDRRYHPHIFQMYFSLDMRAGIKYAQKKKDCSPVVRWPCRGDEQTPETIYRTNTVLCLGRRGKVSKIQKVKGQKFSICVFIALSISELLAEWRKGQRQSGPCLSCSSG